MTGLGIRKVYVRYEGSCRGCWYICELGLVVCREGGFSYVVSRVVIIAVFWRQLADFQRGWLILLEFWLGRLDLADEGSGL